MNGNGFSQTEVSLFFRIGVFGIVLLLHGCLQQPKPVVPSSLAPVPPVQQTTLITEVLAEAESLRTAMAAERIKAAKQTANIRTAQNEVSVLRQRTIEHVATISDLKKELSIVKAERDKLQKEIAALRVQTANVPQLLEMVAHVRILETSLVGMVSSIDALSNETAQLKEEVKKQQAVAARSQKFRSSGLAEREPHAEGTDSIVVKRGDSLWRLAHRHDTTVAEIKALNHLESDLILVGQLLNIPSPATSLGEQHLVESLEEANDQPDH